MSDVAQIRVDMGSLESLQSLVADAGSALVWVLDAAAHPHDDALEELMEHAPGPAASLPVDPSGQAVAPLMGRVDESDHDAILAAIERRAVPLRHVALTSLLVERQLVLELAPPDPGRFGWYAGAEWTARLFRRRPGVLVPRSRVTVDDCPTGSPVHLLRAAQSAGWRKGETARELHRSVGGVLA